MADIKAYYYIRLKENFYEKDEIIQIEMMKNGYLFINILQKLYLKSLKNNGYLLMNNGKPFDVKTIAVMTRHKPSIVKQALEVFKEYNLLKVVENGALSIPNIDDLIGKSSNVADNERKRFNKKKEQENLKNETRNLAYSKQETLPKAYSYSYSLENIYKEDVVIYLKYSDGNTHGITKQDINNYKSIYPNIDVEQELKKLAEWIKDDSGYKSGEPRKLITAWLNKAKPIPKQPKEKEEVMPNYNIANDEIADDLMAKYLGDANG